MTSSVNVAFFGREIVNGREDETDNMDESVNSKYLDAYSRTKKIAEDIVKEAHRKNGLKTAILRFVKKKIYIRLIFLNSLFISFQTWRYLWSS